MTEPASQEPDQLIADEIVDEKEPGLVSGVTQAADTKGDPGLRAAEPIAAPLQEVEPRTPEELYTQFLRTIWNVVHPNATPGARQEQLWEAGRAGVLSVIEPAALSGRADTSPSGGSSGAIAGTVVEVELLVANDVDQLADPARVVPYVHERLAPTFERFERMGEGSRERRVDVVVRALRPLAGLPGTVRLVTDSLVGYLEGQPEAERDDGFYATVGNLAVLCVGRQNAPARSASLVLYHRVLDGMMALARHGVATDPRTVAANVTTAAGNAAALIALAQLDEDRDAADARLVLVDLLTIAAATARSADVEDERATTVLALLDLTVAGPPGDVVAVLSQMVGAGAPWGEDLVEVSRLESAGGIAKLLEGQGTNAVSGMFNAAVSLDRHAASDTQPFLEGQLVLNGLGLWIATETSDTLLAALVDSNGLRCAVNLLGTAVTYHDVVPGARWRELVGQGFGELLSALAALGAWDSLTTLGDDSVRLSVARVARAVRRLDVSAAEGEVDKDSLVRRLRDVLRALLPDWRPSGDLAVDCAGAVRAVFAELLAKPEWELGQRVKELSEKRADPAGVLERYYAPYTAGDAPPVAAGIISRSDWDTLGTRLLQPVTSVAARLRAFSIE